MALVGEFLRYRNEKPVGHDVQLLTWDDCSVHGQPGSSGIRETQGCESTHSPRGHEGQFYAGLGDGTWTTRFKGAW